MDVHSPVVSSTRLNGDRWEMGLSGFLVGQHLAKRMDFDSFKHSMGEIGVAIGDCFCFLHGLRFNDDQTPGLITEGSGTDQLPLILDVFKVLKVSRPIEWALTLALRSIPSDNDVFHVSDVSSFLWARVRLPWYPSWISCHHSMRSSPSFQHR